MSKPVTSQQYFIRLDRLSDDASFRLRDGGNLDTLSTSLVQEGQLFPIDVRPADATGEKYQVITGFRRVAVLRELKRDEVLARVHPKLSDLDALRLALTDLLGRRRVTRGDLEAVRGQVEQGEHPRITALFERLTTDDLLAEETSSSAQASDVSAWAADVTRRLAALNRELVRLAEQLPTLPLHDWVSLHEQLAYPQQVLNYLKGNP